MNIFLNIIRRANGFLGFVLLFIVLLAACIGFLGLTSDPNDTDFMLRFAAPSAQHWFGTDMFGRDQFSRIISGATVSVMISALTVIIAVSLGVLIGASCGFFGGWIDRITMMFIEALMAFPSILLALTLMAIMGPNKYGVVLALSLGYLPSVVRLVRGTVLSVKEREYVEASVAFGNSAYYTLFKHILPNSLAPLIVLSTTMFGWALLAESSLSFLGLGVPPPAPTWGNMLAEAKGDLLTHPLLGIIPGACISITLLGINFLGDALRDELDPRSRKLS